MGIRETIGLLANAGGEEDIASLISQLTGEAEAHFSEYDSMSESSAGVQTKLDETLVQLELANERINKLLDMNSVLLKGSTSGNVGETGTDEGEGGDSGEGEDVTPNPEEALNSIKKLDELELVESEQD